jgi:hypothetical protein
LPFAIHVHYAPLCHLPFAIHVCYVLLCHLLLAICHLLLPLICFVLNVLAMALPLCANALVMTYLLCTEHAGDDLFRFALNVPAMTYSALH